MTDTAIPKVLASAADRWFQVRTERLALQKQVDALQKQETLLAEHLINNLPKSHATGIAGKLVRVSITQGTRWEVKDWDKVYAHILKNAKKDPGVWALMQRRLSDVAVKELAEAGKPLAGVEAFTYPKISYSAL